MTQPSKTDRTAILRAAMELLAQDGLQGVSIRSVAGGEAIFGPGVAQRVLSLLQAPPSTTAPVFPELTPREHEILDLLAAGLSNAVIANRIGVAYKTVANNVSSIFGKLQVTDRSQAIVTARDAGLGRD